MRMFPNSPTHRVLALLEKNSSSPATLHKATKTAGQSFVKWGIDVLGPLTHRGLLNQQNNTVYITTAGLELFYDLERKSNVPAAKVAGPRKKVSTSTKEMYVPPKNLPMRPGAEDFLNCPSRVGSQLIYRPDAKLEEVV